MKLVKKSNRYVLRLTKSEYFDILKKFSQSLSPEEQEETFCSGIDPANVVLIERDEIMDKINEFADRKRIFRIGFIKKENGNFRSMLVLKKARRPYRGQPVNQESIDRMRRIREENELEGFYDVTRANQISQGVRRQNMIDENGINEEIEMDPLVQEALRRGLAPGETKRKSPYKNVDPRSIEGIKGGGKVYLVINPTSMLIADLVDRARELKKSPTVFTPPPPPTEETPPTQVPKEETPTS